jgi:hypothetical protein
VLEDLIDKIEKKELLLKEELNRLLHTLSKEKKGFKAKRIRGKELQNELELRENQKISAAHLLFYTDYIDRFLSGYQEQIEKMKILKVEIDKKIYEIATIKNYRKKLEKIEAPDFKRSKSVENLNDPQGYNRLLKQEKNLIAPIF